MRVLFLQPPLGSWVTWGNHKPINVSHAQMSACVRKWVPEAEVKVLDCRALGPGCGEDGLSHSGN